MQYAAATTVDVRPLPPLDVAGLKPQLALDTTGITEAIKALWGTVQGQQQQIAALLDTVDDQKRQLASVAAQAAKRPAAGAGPADDSLQGQLRELDAKLVAEARQRREEDGRLRAELGLLQQEMGHARRDMERQKTDLETSMENMAVGLRTTVGQAHDAAIKAQDTALDARERVGAVEERAEGLAMAQADLEHRLERLHKFLGVSVSGVEGALRSSGEKDAMLRTPAPAHIVRMIRALEEKVQQQLAQHQQQQQQVVQRQEPKEKPKPAATPEELEALLARVRALEMAARAAQENEEKTAAALAALKEADSGIRASVSSLEKCFDARCRKDDDALARLRAQVDTVMSQLGALQTRLAGLEGDLHTRALQDDMLQRCKTAVVDAHVERLLRMIQEQAAKIRDLEGALEQLAHAPPPDASKAPRAPTVDPAALLELRDALNGINSRMSAAERSLTALAEGKVDRDELTAAIGEALRAVEAAVNHIYDESARQHQALQRQQQQAASSGGSAGRDGTSGRFRCLSCNRDAGPLQDEVQQRLSAPLLPPSTTAVRIDDKRRANVPGLRDGYGGGPGGTARRKVSNYFDWLDLRTDTPADSHPSPSPPGGVVVAAPDLTPRRGSGMWLGAQAGGGPPRERQSGDHGSEDPEGIGTDGKYYVGVRPGSAGSRPNSRPTSAGATRKPSSGTS